MRLSEILRAGLLTILALATSNLTVSAEEVIQQMTANGTRNLRPFTVKDGWELRWEASGDHFSAWIYSPNGDPVDSLARQRKPGSGSSYYPKGGTYHLRVIAVGEWTLTVVQLP